MKLLIVAPHPDDESIGCGGTIALRCRQGDTARVVCLSSGELGLKSLPRAEAWRVREAEALRAARVLGVEAVEFLRKEDWGIADDIPEVAAALRERVGDWMPDIVYAPHPAEDHPDHAAACAVVEEALRADSPRPTLLLYEVWTPMARFDEVEDVTSSMETKIKAVRCYRSQLGGFRYDTAVRALNRYRGVLAAHSRYAEVFAYA